MRHLAVTALLLAAISVTAASETGAQPSEDPPLPLVIDDDGTIRMHGDTLVVRPDGTVSMGAFEFKRNETGELWVGHPGSDQRLAFTPDGAVYIGSRVAGGLTVFENGFVRLGYDKAGFAAHPNGVLGLLNRDGKRQMTLENGQTLVFGMQENQKVITGTVAFYRRNRDCETTGSGSCANGKPACISGPAVRFATPYADDFELDQYVCFGP